MRRPRSKPGAQEKIEQPLGVAGRRWRYRCGEAGLRRTRGHDRATLPKRDRSGSPRSRHSPESIAHHDNVSEWHMPSNTSRVRSHEAILPYRSVRRSQAGGDAKILMQTQPRCRAVRLLGRRWMAITGSRFVTQPDHISHRRRRRVGLIGVRHVLRSLFPIRLAEDRLNRLVRSTRAGAAHRLALDDDDGGACTLDPSGSTSLPFKQYRTVPLSASG